MPYKIQSTERYRESSSEHETKSLLYLMSLRQDSQDIEYFVIDFFNDVSGVDKFTQKIWDLQSKASKTNSAKDIGKALVTLFKNYNQNRELPFEKYILFVGGVSNKLRQNNDEIEFGFNRVKPSELPKVIEGLKEICNEKTYIEKVWITDSNIENFLSAAVIHISILDKKEYIKKVITSTTIKMPTDDMLSKIFNEIKNKQACKKDISVENEILNRLDDFLHYNKHLKRNEILLLILNRIINSDIMATSVPVIFITEYNLLPEDTKNDILEDCRNAMALILHDKNNSDNIWALYDNIYKIILANPQFRLNEIYDLVDKDLAKKVKPLEALSLKYLISVIKGGIR